MTPRLSTRGSDQGSICPHLLKYLRAELWRDSSVRQPGFTKKVYILSDIDPGTSREGIDHVQHTSGAVFRTAQ